ncbi:MAG: uncharacterized protein KVP18_003317 [Porospora cf. gigantea A]|uniref:uncharacterized protein n=1 Tax=Porospora cf. gigantea A TaxID=2853593 RepID=UPI00355A356C|nr:MAG: hypothetical protein KVP18_003317 [Porospora cf. gigantea A]
MAKDVLWSLEEVQSHKEADTREISTKCADDDEVQSAKETDAISTKPAGDRATSALASLLSFDAPPSTQPLAHRLLSALSELLFSRNFCVDLSVPARSETERAHVVATRCLWQGGVAHKPVRVVQSDMLLRNRCCVLTTLTTVLSEPVFAPPSDKQQDWPILTLYASGELPYTATLFSSLLSCTFRQKQLSVVEGTFFRDCCLLIDGLVATKCGKRNVFEVVLSNLKATSDLEYLVQGFDVRLGALDKSAAYFADESPMDATHLVCILLWKLLSTNEDFFAFFVLHAQAPSIIRRLLRYAVRTATACFQASHEKVSRV